MAFTIDRHAFSSKHEAFEHSTEIHIARVYQHESQGEFVDCLEALLHATLGSTTNPFLIDRSELKSSELDTAELLEALLVLERHRSRLEHTMVVIIYNRLPHPAHLQDVFVTAAELKSMHYLKLVESLADAQKLLGMPS